ncbi:MAG: EcsC family protein [Alphaproteobacteria bacterium]|nr:EcsC family protein [Alphaproteobacteria bacterium]
MNDAVPNRPEFTSRRSNACALLNEDEFRRLIGAAETYVSARSFLMSFLSSLGNVAERGLKKVPQEWQAELVTKTREVLDFAQRVSIARMDNEPGRQSSATLYAAVAAVSGAGSGTLGLPAVLAELPITTGLILRSIADVGRSCGERLDDPQFTATCIEVFAYGGPLEEDDDADIAFLMTRLGAVELADFIGKVAIRYAAAMTPRILAMSVPVAGALLGAGINWTYMRFYQSMAQVLFTLLPIERVHDSAQVRSCFASLTRELANQRNGRQKAGNRS